MKVNKLIFEPVEGNAWHADHVIPVYKGGGECRLENMRTLCVACHSKVTAAQRVERRLARSEAKKQLKSIMRELEATDEFSDANNDIEDDALLIKVPGSAYSVDNTASEDDESPKVLQPGDQIN
ncbi:DNA annealing helicase and endonuclease [Nymphaea thermarum]|nr:DNA annealing helicase and endonuclease [Nymphaea thermarum]